MIFGTFFEHKKRFVERGSFFCHEGTKTQPVSIFGKGSQSNCVKLMLGIQFTVFSRLGLYRQLL
jgi:hypothetical protein